MHCPHNIRENSTDQYIFFQCSMIQFGGLCTHCRHFWWWARVSIGTGLTGKSSPNATSCDAGYVLTSFHHRCSCCSVGSADLGSICISVWAVGPHVTDHCQNTVFNDWRLHNKLCWYGFNSLFWAFESVQHDCSSFCSLSFAGDWDILTEVKNIRPHSHKISKEYQG